jgi:hypothetical protein
MDHSLQRRCRLALVVALAFGLGAGATIDLYKAQSSRRISIKTDLRIYPEPAPPPLPRAGGKFTDETFGSEIMRVTDESGGGSSGTSYSYWPTFNCNNTRILVMHDGSPSGEVYDFDPVRFTLGAKRTISSLRRGHVLRGEDAIWSAHDPDILFAHTDFGAQLWAYNVATNSFKLIGDLSRRLKPNESLFQMSKSENDDVFAFTRRGPPEGYAFLGYIVYRVATDTVLRQGFSVIDECQVDKSGRYLYIQTGLQGIGQVYGRVLNIETGEMTDLQDAAPDQAPGHEDAGAGTVIGNSHYINVLTKRSYASPHNFTTVFNFKDSWYNPMHTSMLAINEDWVLFSFYGTAAGGVYADLFKREIVQIKTDGSQQVRRLLHHHSVYQSYYDTPRANISRDGQYIAFTSNWGGRNRRDLFIARIEPAPDIRPQTRPRKAGSSR